MRAVGTGLFLGSYTPFAVLGLVILGEFNHAGGAARLLIPVAGPPLVLPYLNGPFSPFHAILILNSAVQAVGLGLLTYALVTQNEVGEDEEAHPLAVQVAPMRGGAYACLHLRF